MWEAAGKSYEATGDWLQVRACAEKVLTSGRYQAKTTWAIDAMLRMLRRRNAVRGTVIAVSTDTRRARTLVLLPFHDSLSRTDMYMIADEYMLRAFPVLTNSHLVHDGAFDRQLCPPVSVRSGLSVGGGKTVCVACRK